MQFLSRLIVCILYFYIGYYLFRQGIKFCPGQIVKEEDAAKETFCFIFGGVLLLLGFSVFQDQAIGLIIFFCTIFFQELWPNIKMSNISSSKR